ncbi:NlpC/P60 family protein [Atlantibacter hermannii]|uniref:NlpC/P60 family protein n=1 Tax=Atlantibacter hermannii TaxID=565 RepID=UPI00193238D0|nr:NlpC/P60 family protein [Atlantibacter hermannii]MBL7637776.1 C40 family peptidase [Atlantibacter hermannii]MBL7675887.1 C40 family peptidase [Atlantibacter hermannii]
MTKDEFIRKVNGLPWADRACSFEAVDCWGLVVLYYRHVLNVEVHQTPDYEAGKDFITCYEGDRVFWLLGARREGSIGVFYRGGVPDHVGIVIGGNQCLHSKGEGGSVRIDPLPVLERAFTRTEFLQYGNV